MAHIGCFNKRFNLFIERPLIGKNRITIFHLPFYTYIHLNRVQAMDLTNIIGYYVRDEDYLIKTDERVKEEVEQQTLKATEDMRLKLECTERFLAQRDKDLYAEKQKNRELRTENHTLRSAIGIVQDIEVVNTND